MKKIYRYFLCGVMALTALSCDSFLDVNENPNEATSTTPQLVLPTALAATASNSVSYTDYGSFLVGYIVNAGGFGGWSTQFTYAYTTANYGGLWSSTYDNLNDYHYIETTASGNEELAYYEAIGKIMKAYNFQLLVDTYGNVPYTEALQGGGNLTPSYDNGEEIYQDLVEQLDAAVALIDNASTSTLAVSANSDIMFGGNMGRWTRFANTLKLRLLVRASRKPGATVPGWVTTQLNEFTASTPFLQEDAVVNPGYLPNAGQQNPLWNLYHSDAAGATTATGRSRIPSRYVFSFYGGTGAKIVDDTRGALIYRGFPNSTPVNQLGVNDNDVPTAPSNSIAWYTGTGTGLSAANTTGIFKGRTMGQPLMLAAESHFLQAEARARGFITGDAKSAFRAGIESSFRYLMKDVTGAVVGDPVAATNAYIAANQDNDLVNFDLATSLDQQMEAIITQKYIALNFLFGHEAWNEFRRTGYPAVSGTSATSTFASTGSTSPRADRLPLRILYPASEYSLNPNNAPSGVTPFDNPIFWDVD
ncbi:SusD/RagB family nutrient-binding outer membrane lipoprotein [Rufibacter roseus]|uniref:SusD/RagB family nutrient-binding outer membrane lipoprotein n=1 Tax=Rufibacter roseus TaxID=1567108 RepID=A0ABW2DIP8_9BACT|nr:SusD/RagB family nutrient-binding outer membrane lipoprotein [Rufibacter roseus]